MSNQLSASYVRRLLFVAAAGVGAVGFVPRAHAADPVGNALNAPSSNTPVIFVHLPDGFVEKEYDGAAGDIRNTLVNLTQRAVAKDSYDSFFSGFLSELATRDKARAREFKGADQQHMNDAIGQIQTEWRAKYGQDFDVSAPNLAFDDKFHIAEGEVTDPAAASASWMPYALAGQAADPGTNADQQKCNTGELSEGRKVAIIRFPAGDGLPDMNVSLIHQRVAGWRIDLPVERSGELIYNDLSTHLTYFAAHQDQWPTDVNEAYRMVARNVVAALYGVTSPGGTASAQ
jgi:hypothetical protein